MKGGRRGVAARGLRNTPFNGSGARLRDKTISLRGNAPEIPRIDLKPAKNPYVILNRVDTTIRYLVRLIDVRDA